MKLTTPENARNFVPDDKPPETKTLTEKKMSKVHLYIIIAILSLGVLGLCLFIIWETYRPLEETSSELPPQEYASKGNGSRMDTSEWTIHTSSFFSGKRIAYECPPEWEFETVMESDNTLKYASCTSPTGSVFKHLADENWNKEIVVCSQKDGDTVILGDYPLVDAKRNPMEDKIFLRHFNVNTGEWFVCEKSYDQTKYTFDPTKGAITLIAKREQDLAYLDEILRSVRAVSDDFTPPKQPTTPKAEETSAPTDEISGVYVGSGSQIADEYKDYIVFDDCDMEMSTCTHYLVRTDQAAEFEDVTDLNLNQPFTIEGIMSDDEGGAAAGHTYIILEEVTDITLVE